ncbi:unnamed protein product [Gongylonema pulchrum]|uniref:VWFD domain-containing protein n=1 Tax=Gongylonema pulchrum TaxID=637853 RepID=A0A183DJK3_9BILA|nr:unnamed protein product [Gongylonema pulchrum]
MINCVCPNGYTGDPFKGCTVKSMIAGMAGDPHCRTFDEQRFDYMGTCPYYYVVPCGTSFPKPFGSFWLKAKNQLSFPNAHVSTVSEFEVHLQDQTYHVDRMYNLYMNGIHVTMPHHFPDRKNSKVRFSSTATQNRSDCLSGSSMQYRIWHCKACIT